MNIKELEDELNKMNEKGLEGFVEKVGGRYKIEAKFLGGLRVPDVVRYFIEHPEVEKLWCQVLGLPTEEEKRTQAAIDSAKGAIDSAKWATVSAKWAKFAVIAASISVLLSFFTFLITFLKK